MKRFRWLRIIVINVAFIKSTTAEREGSTGTVAMKLFHRLPRSGVLVSRDLLATVDNEHRLFLRFCGLAETAPQTSGFETYRLSHGGEPMRRKMPITMLSMVAGVALAASVYADMTTETHETTKTTTKSGTVSEVSPSSSTIIVKSEDAPQPSRYVYNSQTAWVDSDGNKISIETVRNQPVTVYYEKNGDEMVVTRVVSGKPSSKVIEEHKTTTTTTESDE